MFLPKVVNTSLWINKNLSSCVFEKFVWLLIKKIWKGITNTSESYHKMRLLQHRNTGLSIEKRSISIITKRARICYQTGLIIARGSRYFKTGLNSCCIYKYVYWIISKAKVNNFVHEELITNAVANIIFHNPVIFVIKTYVSETIFLYFDL